MVIWMQLFIYSFAVGFSAVASPGPVSTAIVSQAPRRGWLVGPLVATGHSLTELIMMILIAAGLSAGMARPGVQTLIAIVGGLLLVWMGGNMLSDAISKKVGSLIR
jgi:threonine/homoserine/homoserine lactone efflux protein